VISDRKQSYDIVIVGAGPGGLFCAYNIVRESGDNNNILIVDKGKPLIERVRESTRGSHRYASLISGAGGAGLFSDGKLVLDVYSGGYLKDIISLAEKQRFEDEIRKVFERFTGRYIYRTTHFPEQVASCFMKKGLQFWSYPVMHLGSENLRNFTAEVISYLRQQKVEFLFDTQILDFSYEPRSHVWQLETSNRHSRIIESPCLVVSVGKEGNFWLSSVIEKLGGRVQDNNTYIGVRMEVDNKTAKRLYSLGLDPKLCKSYDDKRIKTHCFCRHGQVLLLKYFELPLAGGQTPFIESDEQFNQSKFPNSNFGILYHEEQLCAGERTIKIMQRVDKATGGRLLIQRLADYLDDIPTTPQKLASNHIKPSSSSVCPGRISEEVLPGFRDVFIPFLESLSSYFPGIDDADNLLYAPAIEWWMKRIQVDENMEVSGLSGLYALGDGSGWTQGIVQSAASGAIVARHIVKKAKESTRLTAIGKT
jgi:uncharacterized FAD-dependent dehydrogenase